MRSILGIRARLHIDKTSPTRPGSNLAQAKALIEQTGYHRRDAEVEMLEEVLGSAPDGLGISPAPHRPYSFCSLSGGHGTNLECNL